MKAFNGSQDDKRRAMHDVTLARMGGHLHAWGHYWNDGGMGGKFKGNVTGAALNRYLKPEQVEQDLPDYWEPALGIPALVAEMLDVFFSGLSLHDNKELHQHWPEQVLGAIQPGMDLTRVPDRLTAYMLEQPEWLAAYADEKAAHLVGLMHAIFLLRVEGIDQSKRLADFYYDHIHKLHLSRFRGTVMHLDGYVWAALRHLCSIDKHRGPYGYFLKNAVDGRAAHRREPRGKHWVELSQIFLQMIEDCPA